MNGTVVQRVASVARESGGAWRDRLWSWLRGRATPMAVFDDRIIPAASVWTGCRAWVAEFRRRGLVAGDRVVLAAPPSPGFLMVLSACLWEGLTTAVASPPGDGVAADALAEAIDAACVLGAGGTWSIGMDRHGLPEETGAGLRPARGARTPDVRLLLRTSGTSGTGRWVALSDENILSVLDSHAPRLGLSDARVLSVLPWHHAFGLVIDLLPALAGASEIVRDERGGRDPGAMVRLIEDWDITHASMVPLQASRLADGAAGERALRRLRGGVIGGAPVRGDLARALGRTRLRAGYGLTEAGPGVTLGEPGAWEDGSIGLPVGCEVRVDEEGELWVRGSTVSMGYWEGGELSRREAGSWLRTGDLVERGRDGLRFVGRAVASFKLSNGRLVEAGRIEDRVRRLHAWVEEAVLWSEDGESLEVVLGVKAGCGGLEGLDVSSALGALAGRVRRVRAVPSDELPRTGKGEVDRRRVSGS